MVLQFFLPMLPPTTTHQEKKTRVVNGKQVHYEPPELKAARAKLTAHLAPYAPKEPLRPPVRLIVKWCFPCRGKHQDGEYRVSRPDTDNLEKLLKDVMTGLGYWQDDAHVASEIVEKFWSNLPGLFLRAEELESDSIPLSSKGEADAGI